MTLDQSCRPFSSRVPARDCLERATGHTYSLDIREQFPTTLQAKRHISRLFVLSEVSFVR